MKRFVRLGVAISLCATSAIVQAQSPWGRADREWNGSFLSSDRYYTARRMQDTPQVPEVDSESLPSPSDAAEGSGVQPQAVPPAASDAGNQASSYPEYFGAGPHSNQDGAGLYGSPGEAGCATESCVDGTCMACSPCACCPWYGGIYGLAMTRNDSCSTYLSYETGMPSMPVMTTNSAESQWGCGFETRIGRYLNE